VSEEMCGGGRRRSSGRLFSSDASSHSSFSDLGELGVLDGAMSVLRVVAIETKGDHPLLVRRRERSYPGNLILVLLFGNFEIPLPRGEEMEMGEKWGGESKHSKRISSLEVV
jgi:hypothetical protein